MAADNIVYNLNQPVKDKTVYNLEPLVQESSSGLMRPRDEELSHIAYGDVLDDNYRDIATAEYYNDKEREAVQAGQDLLANGGTPEDLVDLYKNTKAQPKELVDEFSLERAAAKTETEDVIENGGDITLYNAMNDKEFYNEMESKRTNSKSLRSMYEKVLIDYDIDPNTAVDFDTVVKRQRENQPILEQARAQAGQEFMGESWVDIGLQFGKRFLPFVDQYEDAKVLDDKESFLGLPTERMQNRKDVVMHAMQTLEPDQFQIFINSVNEDLKKGGADKLAIMQFWDDMATDSTGIRDVFHALDIAGVAGAAAGIVRGSRVTKNAKSVRSAKEALASGKADELAAIRETTPTALKSDMAESAAAELHNDATELAIDTGAMENFLSKVTVDAKAVDVDYATNFQMFKESFKKNAKFSDRELKTFDIVAMDENTASVTIGHGTSNNKPFVSESAAKKFADKHNIENYTIEKGTDGYKIVATYNIPDNIGADMETWKAAGKPWKQNFLTKWFSSRSGVPDDIFEADVTTSRAIGFEREASRGLSKPVNDLDKKETEMLDKILRNETNEVTWKDDDTLRELGANDKVIEAHNSVKTVNYMDYEVKNANLVYSLDKANIKNIKVEGLGNFYGKEVDDVKDLSTAGFKDLTDGSYYGPNKMDAATLEAFKQAGKKIIKRMSPDTDSDQLITHYIVNPGQYQIEALPKHPIAYVAGPRRIYRKGTLYLKQARTTNTPGAPRLILRPATISADVDNAAVRAMRDELNEVIKLWREFDNLKTKEAKMSFSARVNDLTSGNKYVNIADYDDFRKNWVEAYKLNKDFLTEAVEDGQELESVKKLRLQGAKNLGGDEDFPLNSLQEMLDNNGQHYNHRGEHLRTPNGELTPTVSPQRMMNTMLNRLIYSHTTYHYNDLYARQLKSYFADVIKDNPAYRNMTSSEFLRSVEFIDTSVNKRMRHKIQAAKNLVSHWRDLMFQRTDFDDAISTYMQAFADWLGEKIPAFGRGSNIWENIATARPDKAIRSYAYHMFLGCFNVRQLWLQSLGTVNMYALEPLYAPRAALRYGPLRMSMMTDDTKQLGLISKAAVRMFGDSAEEFENDVKVLKQINAYGPESVQVFTNAGDIMSTNSLRRASTAFVREGERFNFIQANDVALKKIKDMYGKTSKEILADERLMRKVQATGEELYMNMSNASPMRFQKGALSIFTQFMKYPFAFMEALLGKTFTPTQKARLILGNLGMFGVSGTLGVGLYDMGLDNIPGLDRKTFKAINDGALSVAAQELGMPWDLSEAGPSMIEKAYQMLVEGNLIDAVKNIPATSAVLSVSDGVKAMKYIADAIQPESDDSKVMEGMMWFAHESHAPTQFRNLVKAAIASKTGKLYSSKYDILTKKVGPEEVFLTAIGAKYSARKAIEDHYAFNRHLDELYSQAIKDITQAYNRATAAGFDPESQVYRDYKAATSLIIGSIRDIDKRMASRLEKHIAEMTRRLPRAMPDKLKDAAYKRLSYDNYVKDKNILGDNR